MNTDTKPYRLEEKPARVYALDRNGKEICGARQPYGFDHWLIYVSVRVWPTLHQVIATTKETAKEHVEMIAELFTRGA